MKFETAFASSIAIDAAGAIVDWDKRAEQVFGWTASEMLGCSLSQKLIPSWRDDRQRMSVQALAESSMPESVPPALAGLPADLLESPLEVAICHKDGKTIRARLLIVPLADEENERILPVMRRSRIARSNEPTPKDLFNVGGLAEALLARLPDAVVIAESSGRLQSLNRTARRLLNISDSEQAWQWSIDSLAILDENGAPYAGEFHPLARALAGQTVEKLSAMMRVGNPAQDVWLSISALPFCDEEGRVRAAGLILQDVTEWRRSENSARQQTAMYRKQASLLDLTHDALIVQSALDNVITYWNTGAERLYQFTRDEAIGKVSHALLQTRFPLPFEQIRSIVEELGYWEGEVVQKDRQGQEISAHSQWVLDVQEGQPRRYLETNTDITQRVQAERALQRSQEDYRLLVEASTEYAIIMLDPHGVIVSWNPGAEKVLRLAEKEALGKPISVVLTLEDRDDAELMRELQEARSAGRAENDCWHIRCDGSRFWATGVVTPLRNADGSLRGYVKIMRDETEQRVEEEGTQFLAHHDALTGLHNRVSFSNELHKAIARADRTKVPFAVLLLDLDRFKNVNDTLGHDAGDLLLKEVALRIQSSIRETDFVARMGGDEFVVVQSDVSQEDAPSTLAAKLVSELGMPYVFDNMEIVSGTSIGIAIYPKNAANSVELMKRADLAMYRAKHAGRHNYQFYSSDLLSEGEGEESRAAALRKALENHRFELYYQPQVDLDSWRITAVEALLRWHATELDMVLPNEFLAVAEETGLIIEIGEWALREACLQVKQWHEQGMPELRISLNCSARQFSDPKFVAMIPSILDDTGLARSFLELEVSESMLALRPEIKEQLIELRASGVRITIDNFGTGNIALLDLKDLAVDALKIDKEFVRHLPHRRQDSVITSAIIGLARDLGVDVIAGGVETAEQLAYLKAQRCASAQGFIFSPPLSSKKFTELISGDGWTGPNRGISYNLLENASKLH